MSNSRLKKGQTVVINYDEKFSREYPHTFRLFNGKIAVVLSHHRRGSDSLVRINVEGLCEGAMIESRNLTPSPVR